MLLLQTLLQDVKVDVCERPCRPSEPNHPAPGLTEKSESPAEGQRATRHSSSYEELHLEELCCEWPSDNFVSLAMKRARETLNEAPDKSTE